MKIDESLRGLYTKIQEVGERFAKGIESARDMACYYVCKHNLYMALAVQEDSPAQERLRRKASNAICALGKYNLMELIRVQEKQIPEELARHCSEMMAKSPELLALNDS